MKRTIYTVISTVLLFNASIGFANNTLLSDIQQQWLTAISDQKSLKYEEIQQLAKNAYALVLRSPEKAENYLWSGIILSSFSNIKGGKGSKSIAFQAQKQIEKAIQMDPALQNKDIEYLIEKAITYNPDKRDIMSLHSELIALVRNDRLNLANAPVKSPKPM